MHRQWRLHVAVSQWWPAQGSGHAVVGEEVGNRVAVGATVGMDVGGWDVGSTVGNDVGIRVGGIGVGVSVGTEVHPATDKIKTPSKART